MGVIRNPHDKYFRLTMADPDTVRSFLTHYLPREMVNLFELTKIDNVTDYYFDEQMQEYFTDLVFSASMMGGYTGYICLLFEHKSYVDPGVSLQILEYMSKIWRKTLERTGKPSLILPVLFYHGQEDWDVGSSLAELFEEVPDCMKVHFPDFKYHLFDTIIFEEGREKLPDHPRFGAFIRLLLASRMHAQRNKLIGEALKLASLVSDSFFHYSTIYLLSSVEMDIEELLIIVIREIPTRRDEIMTIAEKLTQEGMKEGMKEGIKEGIKEGWKKGVEVTLKLKNRFGDESLFLMKELSGIGDIDYLQQLEDAIDKAQTLDDLRLFVQKISNELRD